MGNWRMFVGLALLAALLALGGYLFIQTRANRNAEQEATSAPVPAENGTTTTVEDIPVVVNPDTSQSSEVQGETAPPPAPETQPTATLPDAEVQAPQTAPAVQTVPTVTFTPPAPQTGWSSGGALGGAEPQIVTVPYVVVSGDNLYRVSEKHNSRVSLLAAYNIAENDVVPGVTLLVPMANPNYCLAGYEYVVGEGETAASIAVATGTTTQALAVANGLDANYTVRFNTVLCIP